MIAPTGVTLVIQVLVAVFVASVWLTLRRPDTLGVAWTNRMGFALLGWSAGAAAFTLHPRLITLREEVAWVQPTVIASAVLIALALQMSPDVRATFRRSATQPLLLQFVWRIVFGALLALLWSVGGLPTAFAVPAAIGDIAVGLWALALIGLYRCGKPPGSTHLHLWNAAGLLDLVNVMRLATTTLVPWFADRPDLPRFAMLPLLGVPLFLALHLHIWRSFRMSPVTSSGIAPKAGDPTTRHGAA